jgi:hypothetical protein
MVLASPVQAYPSHYFKNTAGSLHCSPHRRGSAKEMLLPDEDFAARSHLLLCIAQETTAIFKSPLRCFMC